MKISRMHIRKLNGMKKRIRQAELLANRLSDFEAAIRVYENLINTNWSRSYT